MADLTTTYVANNYRKVTTGTNVQGATLKFYTIDFGVDIRQADGASEVTDLVYRTIANLGFTPTLIGAIDASTGETMRFAIELTGGSVEAIDSTANHGYVRSVSVAEPVVNYYVGSTLYTDDLSTALQDQIAVYTAFPYTDDSGAAQTIDLSDVAVAEFVF